MALPVTPSTTEIYYPDTDGLPVVESDFQLGPLIYALDALRAYFQGRDEVTKVDKADVPLAGEIITHSPDKQEVYQS